MDNCPICNHNTVRTMKEVGAGYSLCACPKCGIHFFYPLLKPSENYYEGEQQGFYRLLHSGKKRLDTRTRKVIKEILQHSFPENTKLLDLGCGDGLFLSILADKKFDVYGLDFDMKSVNVARNRGLGNIILSDLDNPAVIKRLPQFNIITMVDVLEHTTDPVKILRLYRQKLEKGGILVGTIPNRERIFHELIGMDYPPHHFFRFDVDSLRTVLEQGGYVVNTIQVFEYGYSHTLFVKWAKRYVWKTVSGSHSFSLREKSSAEQPYHLRVSRNHLSLAIKRNLYKVIMPVAASIEWCSGKGYKIFFKARKLEM